MKKLVLITLVSLAIACSSSKHNTTPAASAQSAPDSQPDGSSFEKAVVIRASSEGDGVGAEYKWLKKHYPGYTNKGQSLTFDKGKPYDILNITTTDGQQKAVFFDISGFFGKGAPGLPN